MAKHKRSAPLKDQPANNRPPHRGRPFEKGRSGNPKGRPPGSRSKVSLLVEGLLEANAAELTQALIARAMEGSTHALELCFSRLAPVRKDRVIEINLPQIETAADVLAGYDAVLSATASGVISVQEASGLSSILEMRRKCLETMELERRLGEIESRLAAAGASLHA